MKYTHLIYNSSEKNRAGGVGFGVRSATEGLSEEIIRLLEQNEIFSFSELGEDISSGKLSENPDSIRQIVPVYFFRSLSMPDRSRIYALGRKMAVGFDYTFYLNGKPGRLGNYVVDTYIFPEVPGAEEFEILLESAASDSNSFIPADPAPRPENEEMRSISIGHKPDLPIEERPFSATARPIVTLQTISLLFAFISAMKEGKPVLVKADTATPPELMAALATLVPEEQIQNLTFISNHSDEGKKQGVNIVFINEYYTFEIFRKQWVMLDLTKDETFESEESRIFRPMVEKYVEEGDLQSVRNLTGWCLSDIYDRSKALPRLTQEQLFSYLYDFPSFNLHNLETDPDLLKILSSYLADNPEKKAPLLSLLENEYNGISGLEDLYRWINLILHINPIDTSAVTGYKKEQISQIVFSDPKVFAKFFRRYRDNWGKVSATFLTPDSFRNHNAFLSALTPAEWEMLYPAFLAEFKDNRKYLIKRMITDRLPADIFARIVDKEIPDKNEYAILLIDLLKDNPGEKETRLVALTEETLAKSKQLPCDFIRHFSNCAENPLYAPLYILQIEKAPVETIEDVKAMHGMLSFFIKNPIWPKWFESKTAKGILLSIYNTIKRNVAAKTISRTDADDIVFLFTKFKKEFPLEIRRKFNILYDALQRKEESDRATIGDLWNIAEELGDMEYLCTLAPRQIKAYTVKDPEALHDLIGTYIINDYISEEEVMALYREAKKDNKKGNKDILKGIIRYRKGKPMEILAFLTDTVGMNEDEAMAYLEDMFPNTHKKILKSREPSVMDKVGGIFKNIFGKKKSVENQPDRKKKEKE